MYFSTRARIACAAAIASAFALTATAAAGAAANPTWGCRASASSVQVANADTRSEPTVAGGKDPSTCGDASAGDGPTQTDQAGTHQGPFATTSINPDSGPTADQTASGSAGVQRSTATPQDGGIDLALGDVRAEASGRCVDGRPVFNGSSKVNEASLNGTPIPIEDTATPIAEPINGSPPGQSVQIKFNEQVKTPSGITQRAVRVTVTDAQGNLVREEITGEVRVTANGDVCSRNGSVSGPGITSEPGGADNRICPDGSSYDPARNLCVIEIRSTTGGGNGTGGGDTTSVIIVGRPGDVPRGGTVIPITKLTGDAKKSPCANPKLKGPRYAVVGTKKADKVTGTNKADRIILLAGKDKGSGGRDDDCVDGGKGNDTLEGALGNDRLYGMTGKDTLLASSGNDRSYGGAGNDKIRSDYGADVVDGGAGNDRIVTTTRGPSAKVNCGSGRKDRARMNAPEARKSKGCERRTVGS